MYGAPLGMCNNLRAWAEHYPVTLKELELLYRDHIHVYLMWASRSAVDNLYQASYVHEQKAHHQVLWHMHGLQWVLGTIVKCGYDG